MVRRLRRFGIRRIPEGIIMAKSPVPTFLRRKVLAMWVWVIDQLWIFVCIGIAGGIAGAIYQSRRAQVDEETSPTELSKPS